MSIFLLPKTFCIEINSLMQKVWWGHKENEKKIHQMSWEKIGHSKAQGGMGFQDLTCFIKALLAKQCCRLTQDPHSLKTHVEANVGSRPSLAWRSINSAKGLLFEGLI